MLGCCLLEGRACVERVELEPVAFYTEAHRIIFAAMRALAERGEAVALLTVQAELHEIGELETFNIDIESNGVTPTPLIELYNTCVLVGILFKGIQG